MSKIVSYNSFDYKPVIIVPVIASFDTDGHIVPLYVRINGVSLKIDSFWTRNNFSNTTEYNCKVLDQDSLRPVLLTYYHQESIWAIPKNAFI